MIVGIIRILKSALTLQGLAFSTAVFACIGTILGFFGRQWWVFELATHFRFQYLLVLLICALVFLLAGKYSMAVASVGLAVVNLSVVGFGEVGGRIQAPSVSINGKKLRAVLANVNHGNHGYERLYKLVRYTGPDIVVLLEVNSSWMQALEPLRNIYPYSYGKLQDEQGIALLSRIPFENAVITIIDDVGLPSLIARFKIGRQPLTLIGTHPYAPSSSARAEQRNRQLSAVARFIADQKGPVVLIGDLNITPWSPFFADFLRDSGLRDTRNGFGLQPTWPAGFSALIPIDHCLVSPHVQVHHREVGPNIGSDHYPVVIDFSLPHP